MSGTTTKFKAKDIQAARLERARALQAEGVAHSVIIEKMAAEFNTSLVTMRQFLYYHRNKLEENEKLAQGPNVLRQGKWEVAEESEKAMEDGNHEILHLDVTPALRGQSKAHTHVYPPRLPSFCPRCAQPLEGLTALLTNPPHFCPTCALDLLSIGQAMSKAEGLL